MANIEVHNNGNTQSNLVSIIDEFFFGVVVGFNPGNGGRADASPITVCTSPAEVRRPSERAMPPQMAFINSSGQFHLSENISSFLFSQVKNS